MRATISIIASSLPLLVSLAQATWVTMVDGGGCMNVAPDNLDGWKGDLDPYDQVFFNNGSRVPYTSVCSVWGSDLEDPKTPIQLTLNNPINLGGRGQATISSIWQKVYPAASWGCSPYFNCPYTSPGCTTNFTWDPTLGVIYLKNFTSPLGVEDPNTVCLWYENQTSIVVTDEQYQCCTYESSAPTLPLQVNPYYNGWGQPYRVWPSVPWWWLQPFASSS